MNKITFNHIIILFLISLSSLFYISNIIAYPGDGDGSTYQRITYLVYQPYN